MLSIQSLPDIPYVDSRGLNGACMVIIRLGFGEDIKVPFCGFWSRKWRIAVQLMAATKARQPKPWYTGSGSSRLRNWAIMNANPIKKHYTVVHIVASLLRRRSKVSQSVGGLETRDRVYVNFIQISQMSTHSRKQLFRRSFYVEK